MDRPSGLERRCPVSLVGPRVNGTIRVMLTKRRSPRGGGRVAFLLGVAWFLGTLSAFGQAPRAVGDIEKDMRQAVAAQNWVQLGSLVEEAASAGGPDACRAIVTWGCRGDDRAVELKAFRVLNEVRQPEALAILWNEAVRSPNFKTRIILLGVASHHPADPGALAALAHGAKDASRPVALTAVRWLRDSKDAARAVPALIDALAVNERAQRGRLIHDIKKALATLTGGAELDTAADWKNYWDAQKAGVGRKTSSRLTKALPPKSTFFGVPVESDRILFIIDTSESMEKKDPPLPEAKDKEKSPEVTGRTVVRKTGREARKKPKEEEEKDAADLPMDRQRLFRVQQELIRSIQNLPENVRFAVEAFDNEIAFSDDPPKLLPATKQNKERAIQWVKNMRAKGETWTDTAFERGLTQLSDVDTIYLLSDGQPYRNGAKIPQDQVLEDIKTLNRFIKARVHAIGFVQAGLNLQQFLYQLARDHDGTYTPLR